MSRKVILEVEHLCKYYPIKAKKPWEPKQLLYAVEDVSFQVYEGETIGIVGESGCGKSTLGQCILQLQKPTSGIVRYRGQELQACRGKELRKLRGKLQMVFQDPYSSLSPRKTIGKILAEPLEAQASLGNYEKSRIRGRVEELIQLVGLEKESLKRYPHEFSGGQRQRIGIARAFATEPELIICDEAVSALDVSIQAQVVNLLQDLQESSGVSYLFISHDLSVVRHISDRIVILYLGQIVEMGSKEALFTHPMHPYTRMLLDAVPVADPAQKKEYSQETPELPSALKRQAGCCFAERCSCTADICRTQAPVLQDLADGHYCACHRAKEKWDV